MENSKQLAVLFEPQITTMARLMSLNMPKETDTQAIVRQELEYLQYATVFKPEILQCIPETIVAAVKSVIKQNLSLDPDAGLVYITTRNVKVGGAWLKALEAKPTSDGKISIARQCGRIFDIEKPWVTYMADGRVETANIRIQVPAFDEKQQPTTRWETITMGYAQFDRLRYFSHKDKARSRQDLTPDDLARLSCANALYTSHCKWIDPEFACAKVINFAMKRKGTNLNEKRMSAMNTTGERFVRSDIEEENQNDSHEFTEFEVVNNAAPATPAAAAPPPPPPAAKQAAPVQNQGDDKLRDMISSAQAKIAAVTTIKELNQLWKDNKAEWEKSTIIKEGMNDKKSALKAGVPAGSEAPLPPPPPPPVQSAANVDSDFSLDTATPANGAEYEMYKKIFECNTADEVKAYYASNKDVINKNEAMKQYLVDMGRELANARPKLPIPISGPGSAEVHEEKQSEDSLI